MQSYLLAWREIAGLSQEQVGNILGVNRTTLGHWEKLETPMTTDQLARLARVYSISTSQLISPPSEADLVKILDRLQQIVGDLDQGMLEHWIAIGERLRPK